MIKNKKQVIFVWYLGLEQAANCPVPQHRESLIVHNERHWLPPNVSARWTHCLHAKQFLTDRRFRGFNSFQKLSSNPTIDMLLISNFIRTCVLL